MKPYEEMTMEELSAEKQSLEAAYKEILDAGLSLNMARGKPTPIQLDLSADLFKDVPKDLIAEDGTDCRNYGCLDGIPEAKRLMAEIMDVREDQIILFGNASLNIMYDMVMRYWVFGVNGHTPWSKQEQVKWLCPVPGYDRHFAITQEFGFEMINIPMDGNGPDMDLVEKLVAEDDSIKGIWCVPKYSNPTGITFSDEVVRRFAALKPAAEDFRIFWDNAYCVHDLDVNDPDELLPILVECEKNGNADMVLEFASTSKVTFAGAGVSALAASENNLAFVKKRMSIQTIGHDKINELLHVRFLKDREGVRAHMAKHAAIMKPKFDVVKNALESELAPRDLGKWTSPKGGYFVTFYALSGCAKRIVSLCKEAGVTMTGAGAPFPYKQDPDDSVIRIAPSYPTVEELQKAMEVFCLCVRIAAVEKYLG